MEPYPAVDSREDHSPWCAYTHSYPATPKTPSSCESLEVNDEVLDVLQVYPIDSEGCIHKHYQTDDYLQHWRIDLLLGPAKYALF